MLCRAHSSSTFQSYTWAQLPTVSTAHPSVFTSSDISHTFILLFQWLLQLLSGLLIQLTLHTLWAFWQQKPSKQLSTTFAFLDTIYFSCSLCSRCLQSSTPFSFFSSFFSRFSFTRIACMENGTYAPFSSSLPLLLSLSALLTATSNASAVNFP